jgi:aminopeptidase N
LNFDIFFVRRGIHLFLKKYQYSNAVTADLWRELEAVSSKKLAISSIMDTWTRQMGYPGLFRIIFFVFISLSF